MHEEYVMLHSLRALTYQDKRFLAWYAAVILAVYLAFTLYLANILWDSKAESIQAFQSVVSEEVAQKHAEFLAHPSASSQGKIVKVGSFLSHITDLSIRDSRLSFICYVWFLWSGSKDVDPGRHFSITGASIKEKILEDEYYSKDGMCYQAYQILGELHTPFNILRLGLDDQLIVIQLEEMRRVGEIRYIADHRSSISDAINIPGYRVADHGYAARTIYYDTNFGDPRAVGASGETYSSYAVAVRIQRESTRFFWKIVLPFIIASMTAFGTLWINHSVAAPKFTVAGAALFCVLAYSYGVSSLLPTTGGGYGLVDYLSKAALITVFFIICATIFSLYVAEKPERAHFAFMLDKATFVAALPGYLILNVCVTLAAYA